jgi:hypothetical protein
MANTIMMTKTCQFDLMFQRFLKFPMAAKSNANLHNLWSGNKSREWLFIGNLKINKIIVD